MPLSDRARSFFAVNKPLIPLKCILFAYHGGVACLLPYLTIHMRQIGIDVEETAIIYAVLPFTTFLGPPLAGFFADRLGRFHIILVMSLFGSAAFHSALLAVPPTGTVTKAAATELSFDTRGLLLATEACPDQESCPLHQSKIPYDIHIQKCQLIFSDNDTTMDLPSWDETRFNNTVLEFYDRIDVIDADIDNDYIEDMDPRSDWFCVYNTSHEGLLKAINDIHQCQRGQSHNCSVKCSVGIGAEDPLNDDWKPLQCTWKLGNHIFTFGTYFVIRIFSSIFLSICFSMLDATCFALMRKHNSDYGKQKLWSVAATAIFSPITGVLIDHVTYMKGENDYSPAFYMFNFFVLCTIIIAFTVTAEFDSPVENMIGNIGNLLRSIEVNVFLFMIFALGSMWGFVETFLYWYMLDLGSPKYLLGLTMTVGSGISIPFMFQSEKFVRKIGFVNVLVLAFLFYGLRFVGYSMIYDPWWSLVFEAMEVITLHLMWVSSATYGAYLAPKGLLATMQGVMGGVHYGIGRGIGSFIGGTLIKHIGARQTFQMMGIGSFCIGVIYFSIYLACIRKKHQDINTARVIVEDVENEKEIISFTEKHPEFMLLPLSEKMDSETNFHERNDEEEEHSVSRVEKSKLFNAKAVKIQEEVSTTCIPEFCSPSCSYVICEAEVTCHDNDTERTSKDNRDSSSVLRKTSL